MQEAVNGGDVYKIGYEPGKEYQALIDSMVTDSLIDTGIHPDSSHKVMTLSTCTGSGYSRRLSPSIRIINEFYDFDNERTDVSFLKDVRFDEISQFLCGMMGEQEQVSKPTMGYK